MALHNKRTGDLAVQMRGTKISTTMQLDGEISSRNATSILDMPIEILIEIILYLNARERVPLGNSCQKFKTLVFQNDKLLKDLDFSKEGYLTSVLDIEQYFSAASTFMHVRRVNIRNTKCLRHNMLTETIGKAVNLTDVHIHGTAFHDVWHLGSFLNRLPQLRRLSVDWRLMEEDHDMIVNCKVLEKSFGQLTYLAVNLELHLAEEFFYCLQLCQNLKELFVETEDHDPHMTIHLSNKSFNQLRNLEVLCFGGFLASDMEHCLLVMIPDPEKWILFELHTEAWNAFYMEKNLKVCQELTDTALYMPSPGWSNYKLGCILLPEFLLKEILKIGYQDVTEDFCCLKSSGGERVLLNAKDMKELLKNPNHQISYLNVDHLIERGCDVHLIASVFPNITELVLCSPIKNRQAARNQPHIARCLSRRGAVSDKQDTTPNLDSSFKNLVDHTPHLTHLTIQGVNNQSNEYCWDFDALHLISGWRALQSLHLSYIPIEDGDFLIEIGRRCKHLQKLELNNLGSRPTAIWCYKEGLFQMLSHCSNLKDISIEQTNMGPVSEVVDGLLNNLRLSKVWLKTQTIENNIDQVISSIEKLISSCCNFDIVISSGEHAELSLAVQRLKAKFIQPTLEIQVLSQKPVSSPKLKISNFVEDSATPRSFSSYLNRKPNFP